MMIRRFCFILISMILFMTPLTGAAAEESLVELDSEQREWLEYRCPLPDGGLLWCVTEKASKADLDKTVALVKEVLA